MCFVGFIHMNSLYFLLYLRQDERKACNYEEKDDPKTY